MTFRKDVSYSKIVSSKRRNNKLIAFKNIKRAAAFIDLIKDTYTQLYTGGEQYGL